MGLKLNEDPHHYSDKDVGLNSDDDSLLSQPAPCLESALNAKLMCLSSVIWSWTLRSFRTPVRSKRM